MSAPVHLEIDLNCDLGEGGPHDVSVMPLVTSANIACGGHAGDETTMAVAVELARRHGVAIGAHPGHADREHFGRRELPITPAAAATLVVDQVERLAAIAGEPPRHVKLHGGLYHQAARDVSLGAAVADSLVARWPALILVAPAASPLVAVARGRGLEVAEEAFIDRAYTAAGTLVPRSERGAVITDPYAAAARAVWLVRDGLVETSDGGDLALRADTLCIHGDGPDPAALARVAREALAGAGIVVRRVVPSPRGADV